MTQKAVVALAGQRVDAADRATPRFPPSSVELVARRIQETLIELDAVALVSSAACGADLLALREAGALGLRRHVILPFEAALFRHTSVADRGGAWDRLFDRVVAELQATGEVETLDRDPADGDAYAAANARILDAAQALASRVSAAPVAVVVWDRAGADGDSLSRDFIEQARARGLMVVELSTAEDGAP